MKRMLITTLGLFAIIGVQAQEYTTNEVTIVTDTNNYVVNVTNYVTQNIPSILPTTITNIVPSNPTFAIQASADIIAHIANGQVVTSTNYTTSPVILDQWKVDYFFNVWTSNGYHILDPMGNQVPFSASMVKEVVLYRLDDGSPTPKFRLSVH